MSQTISAEELDRATAAGKVELTRANVRPVRCALVGCRRLMGSGMGRRIWLDGFKRGFVCQACAWAVQPVRGGPYS